MGSLRQVINWQWTPKRPITVHSLWTTQLIPQKSPQRTHQYWKKMQHSTWSSIYCPSIDAAITKYVNWCQVCIQHKAQAPIPMMTRDIPNRPWEEIAAEVFTHSQKNYLLICNMFSKYPFLFKMPKKTAETIISMFQELFTQYGPAEKKFHTQWTAFFIRKIHNLHDTTTSTTHHIIPTLPSVSRIYWMKHENYQRSPHNKKQL